MTLWRVCRAYTNNTNVETYQITHRHSITQFNVSFKYMPNQQIQILSYFECVSNVMCESFKIYLKITYVRNSCDFEKKKTLRWI